MQLTSIFFALAATVTTVLAQFSYDNHAPRESLKNHPDQIQDVQGSHRKKYRAYHGQKFRPSAYPLPLGKHNYRGEIPIQRRQNPQELPMTKNPVIRKKPVFPPHRTGPPPMMLKTPHWNFPKPAPDNAPGVQPREAVVPGPNMKNALDDAINLGRSAAGKPPIPGSRAYAEYKKCPHKDSQCYKGQW